MAAVPFADPESVPGLAELYAEIAQTKRGNPLRPNATVSNMGKVLGHSPHGLRAHQGLTRFVLDGSIVPVELRSLASLRTAAVIGCDYIIHNNLPRARKTRLTEAKIQAVLTGADADFDPREKAVVAYAEQVARQRKADPATIAEMKRLFSLREISEIVLTVATYHLVAAIVMPMAVEPDVHPEADKTKG